MPSASKPKIPETPPAPPTPGPERVVVSEDIKQKQRKQKGRKASQLTTPGTLAVQDVNILRRELKDKLGG